jgi:hypothetical protein
MLVYGRHHRFFPSVFFLDFKPTKIHVLLHQAAQNLISFCEATGDIAAGHREEYWSILILDKGNAMDVM